MMDIIGEWVLPLMVVSIVIFGLYKKVRVFDCFMEGAKKGLRTVYDLLPTITGLVVAVTMLKQSGGMELIAKAFSPVAALLGVPEDTVPMALLSPISGGGSLSLFESVLKSDGPDSFLGQVASVLMGSTDTTLYAVTVYYAAVGIKNTRHTLYAGLAADFASFVLSPLFVRLTLY
ncbi:MAG: spore maturation protein [Oscillospiraceae bacterium]|nr:spore maturation protein [Oscillospiraceae bacterium]MDD7292524.1 spore maturation protein [Clostridiaceae bacterium]